MKERRPTTPEWLRMIWTGGWAWDADVSYAVMLIWVGACTEEQGGRTRAWTQRSHNQVRATTLSPRRALAGDRVA